MKILHTSDWHLGKSLYEFSLLEDQAHFIHQLLELLAMGKADAVVIAGDIYDRPVPPAGAMQLYDHFLSRAVDVLGIPVLAVAGNHDSASRLEFGSSLYRKSGYHVVGSARDPVRTVTLEDAFGPVCFSLLPWLHPAEIRSLLETEEARIFDDAWRILLERHLPALDANIRQVAVAHGFFAPLGDDAARRALLTSDSEVHVGGMDVAHSGCFSPFDYAALGHLHAPQRAGGTARYSGSPLKYSLSEESHRKSASLVTLERKGGAEVEEVFFPPLREVRTVSGPMERLLEPSAHEAGGFGDYVFARIEGPECLYPMQKLRTLFPRLLGLRFADLSQEAALPFVGAARDAARLPVGELFARFYRRCRGVDLPEEYAALVEEALAEGEVEL